MVRPIALFHRMMLRARFLLWQRGRLERPVLEHVAGLTLLIMPTVLNPRIFITGSFMAEFLSREVIPASGRVLDMGMGSGVVGLRAAALGAEVIGIDVNPAAVRCARINALINDLESRYDARQGDLFGPVRGEHFDRVLFNPPYFAGEPRDRLDQALRATDVVARYAIHLHLHLRPGGYGLLLWSDRADAATFERAFPPGAFAMRPVASLSTPSETFTIFRQDPLS